MAATTAAPKGYELGQTVSYIEYDGCDRVERTGAVWSYGPFDGSMWVIPDHDPRPVVAVVGRGHHKGHLVRPSLNEQAKRCVCRGKYQPDKYPCCLAYAMQA